MITEILLTSETHHDKHASNGVNIKIYRCDNEENITITIEDDGGKPLLPFSFELDYRELQRGLEKLNDYGFPGKKK